jgi:hypothetical protein
MRRRGCLQRGGARLHRPEARDAAGEPEAQGRLTEPHNITLELTAWGRLCPAGARADSSVCLFVGAATQLHVRAPRVAAKTLCTTELAVPF